MKYSFIIPVYNCKIYLDSCVNSVMETGLPELEILLVDDGSTDGSDEVCDKLSEVFSQVRVIHQTNQGVSAARNHGLQQATGDYVIFLDGDDTIDSGKMVAMLQEVEKDDSIDLAIYGMSFDYYHCQICYRSENLYFPTEGLLIPQHWLKCFSELYAYNAISSSCNKVFKMKILKDYNICFSKSMFLYEDLEFSLKYLAYCGYIYNFAQPIYHYRQSEDEGNAGRRLSRIEHLPVLINQIEAALDLLIEKQKGQAQQTQIKRILLNLYLVLAREKVSISNAEEIRVIGDDLKIWLEKHPWDLEKMLTKSDLYYMDLIKNKKVFRLMQKRVITSIRHEIAVKVKSTKLYQRCKENS